MNLYILTLTKEATDNNQVGKMEVRADNITKQTTLGRWLQFLVNREPIAMVNEDFIIAMDVQFDLPERKPETFTKPPPKPETPKKT